MNIKIAASVMAGNFTQDSVDQAKTADYIHFDIEDGEFVPNKTIWSELVRDLETDLPKDVHLMVQNPEEYVEEFILAGANRISFHIEATDVPEAVIGLIHAQGVEAGIAISPDTGVEDIIPFLPEIDFVLVMTVHPGKGGQKFIKDTLGKIKFIRSKYPKLDIAVDGGINKETAKIVVDAGANILVTGTYIYSENIEEKIRELRKPS